MFKAEDEECMLMLMFGTALCFNTAHEDVNHGSVVKAIISTPQQIPTWKLLYCVTVSVLCLEVHWVSFFRP